ncbi:MAG TPA: isocitrate lyase/PEP mutase family protein [Solirubrobacteraceae bacterium]|nr:isocitrate lyase/PEP mutase family protein [Solirubrobacteraceae bacterium]
MFRSLRPLLETASPVRAPLVLDPLMARLAEDAGFEAVYLGGGGLGYAKTFLEASLSVTEMAQAGIDIAAVTTLPIILDGACGWGDAVHLQRTIGLVEAAGFAAIELEDQPYPKRVGHHAGEDETIPAEQMEAKLRSAVAARRDPDFLIIARTNVATDDPDDALARSERYRAAGADVLMPATGAVRDADVVLRLGRELGPPLMYLAPPGGLAHTELSLADLHGAGYRIVTDAMSLHLSVYAALKAGYRELAEDGFSISAGREAADWWTLVAELHETIGFDALLALERGETPAGEAR